MIKNERIFNSVLRSKILNNISLMLEEISTQEFLFEVVDEYIKITDDKDIDGDIDMVEEKIKEKIVPLVVCVQQFVVESLIPKEHLRN